MAEILVLDSNTIDQIAAGEVVERPASIVKELVENAMDAGAKAVTVEIKDGGRTFIRVTDNGGGIEREQVRRAFYRHATSKIRSMDDLFHVRSLGFRGEALSSIAAVSMVELITKTPEQLTGVHFALEGEKEKDFSEIGAPDGTTIIVRELFFNTPARKKFLKSAVTEASYISDLMEHLALSRPDVAFQFILNGQVKFHTSGNGALKEIVYRIYGKEIARELVPFHANKEGLCIDGFLGSPSIVRANRNYEFFFVNGRYIRSSVLTKGVEAGYKAYLMQHRFPFVLFHLKIDPELIDVNVHPAKMEVRFHEQMELYGFLENEVRSALKSREMIPRVSLDGPPVRESRSAPPPAIRQQNGPKAPEIAKESRGSDAEARQPSAGVRVENTQESPGSAAKNGAQKEPASVRRNVTQELPVSSVGNSTQVSSGSAAGNQDPPDTFTYGKQAPPSGPTTDGGQGRVQPSMEYERPVSKVSAADAGTGAVNDTVIRKNAKAEDNSSEQYAAPAAIVAPPPAVERTPAAPVKEAPQPFETNRLERVLREEEALYGEPEGKNSRKHSSEQLNAEQLSSEQLSSEQLNLFETKILSEENVKKYRILGQAFDTYWIAQYEDKLLFIDQHAAHEKVKYEALIKKLRERTVDSQMLTPPVILNLPAREEHLLQTYRSYLVELGFEIEDFGSGSYAVRAVPCDLFGHQEQDFLEDILGELEAQPPRGTPAVIEEKLASMACKSAVKGNQRMSYREMEDLLGQLLRLDNPYHCPHGRPTMITMSRYELERKFKRII